MSNSDHTELLRSTIARLFSDHLDRGQREAAEEGVWCEALWSELESTGVLRVLVPEEGSGAWDDARVVLEEAGRHAVPLPVAETVLGAWLLAVCELPVPEGPLAPMPVESSPDLRLEQNARGISVIGTAQRVPWASRAASFVVVAPLGAELHVALVEPSGVHCEPGENLAREPRDTLHFDGTLVLDSAPLPERFGALPVWRYGALMRSLQMSGALAHLVETSVRFAGDRVQFGRPIAKFQAIQHQLAVLASEASAASAAARTACLAVDGGRGEVAIAVAKLRAGEVAGIAAQIAHQVHGAIGFTYEHTLQFSTRRLWAWRAEYGAESMWACELGRRVAARGAPALWPDLTDILA